MSSLLRILQTVLDRLRLYKNMPEKVITRGAILQSTYKQFISNHVGTKLSSSTKALEFICLHCISYKIQNKA